MEKIFKSTDPLTRRGVTIGTFDGVHRGHQLVLDTLKRESAERGLEPVAITFDRHPLEIIAPGRAPGMLTTRTERDRLIRNAGVDVCEVAFDDEIRRTTAAGWMRRLADQYGVRLLVIGYDNTFGSDGLDLSLEDFRAIGIRCGIEVVMAPVVSGCSSSAVRRAVMAGDIPKAEEMLGRPVTISGTVSHGRGFGRQIGVPTANLITDSKIILPPAGVYATEAIPEGEDAGYRSVTNIGTAPTVTDGTKTTIETHLIGFGRDLYDKQLTVKFISRIRDEKKFESKEQLTAAIQADIEQAEGL